MCKLHPMAYGLSIKKELLNEIHHASSSHKKLTRRLEHLIDNLPISIEQFPSDLNHTGFAEWFFSRSIQFKKYPQMKENLTQMENIYRELRYTYQTIYTLYAHKRRKLSWVGTFLYGKNGLFSSKERETARQTYRQFEALSRELLKLTDRFEAHLAIQPNENLLIFI